MVKLDCVFKELERRAFTTDALLVGLGILLLTRYLIWVYSRRKYPPGPIGLPFVGYLPFLGPVPHKTLWKMREKYGDVIGLYLGPKYTVVLSGHKVVKEVYTNPASLDRAPDLFSHMPDSGFLEKNGEEWLEQRRFCFSSAKSLGLGKGEWEDSLQEEITDFITDIRASNGASTDITHLLQVSVTTNIISLLIGRRLDRVTEGKVTEMSLEFSEAVIRYMGPLSPATLVPGLRRLLILFRVAGYDRAAEVIKIFRSFFRNEIITHKKSADEKHSDDFINSYLKKLDELKKSGAKNHYFSESMLAGNLNLLYIAANDTTASTMTFLIRLMAMHPDIQSKVYRELTDVLGGDNRAHYAERQKFPYTFAVILETHRYSSSVPMNTTRLANNDIEIGGYIIPKGAEITANLWGMHHDPEYWDEPEKFIPERFLTEDGKKFKTNLPSYAPFSLGKRDCPGQNIAHMAVLSYFSELIRNFEISSAPGEEVEFEIVDGLVTTLKPQALCFKPRDSSL